MKTADTIGIYIHIPFCRSKCPYCDFHSALAPMALQQQYLTALLDEIRTQRRAASFLAAPLPPVASVYIGGGTPSYFGGERIAQILYAIQENYTLTDDAEVTVEVNPDSASEDFFRAIYAAGANRISLGLQSAVDSERRALGRLSGAAAAARAVEMARETGFRNLSLDLMCGIPQQTAESLQKSIDFCLSQQVEHISAYLLQIEENTPFYRRREKLSLPDEDAQCALYRQLCEQLRQNGYRHYEISNFAKLGFESRHNLNYWRCGEYLGLGAAAHSFLFGKRFYYPPDTEGFIQGNAPVFDDAGGSEEEYIMLALRTEAGLNFADFEKRFRHPIPPALLRSAKQKIPPGDILLDETHLALTEAGFLLSNQIIAALLFS